MTEAAVPSNSRVARAPDPLVVLRDLIIKDPVALQKWSIVVDHIVQSTPDVLRIKANLKDSDYAEAVLQSLQVWHLQGGELEDLLEVFRNHGLNALAERLRDFSCKSLLQSCSSRSIRGRTSTTRWFEVTEVVGNFTGRVPQLETLHKMLTESHCQESSDRNVISIVGLRGVGKSTLAKKYAFTHRKFYDGNVVWINAETVDSMRASFVRLSASLGFMDLEKLPNEELAAKVFEQLSDEKCLLIFDNVEEKKDFKQFQPKILNPDWATPHVLVTSCRTDLNLLPGNQLRLDVLTIEEAVQLIQEMLLEATCEVATKLADKLQRLPLALQQALAYIRDKYIGEDDAILKYLKEFEKSEAELLNDVRFRDFNDYSWPTFATVHITMARIVEMDGGISGVKLSNLLAYLNPDWISLQFVRLASEEEAGPGLKLLERFSMVHVSEGKVFIHRLVQQVIRLSLGRREEEEITTLIAWAVEAEFEKSVMNDLVRECTSHGLHLFPFQVKHLDSTKEMSTYLANLCEFLVACGSYTEALLISQQAVSFSASRNGEKHENTIKIKWRMARVYMALENYSESMLVLDSILPTAKSELGPNHKLTLNILSTLADVSNKRGDSATAVRIYEELIPTTERLLGESDPTVLHCKFNAAVALRRLGKLDESLALLRSVHEKEVQVHEGKDVRTSWTKHKIASVHFEKREFSKALEIWEEVEKEFKLSLGETHPDTVQIRTEISEVKALLANLEAQGLTAMTTCTPTPTLSDSETGGDQ